MTDEEIIYVVQQHFSEAKNFNNFWVAREVDPDTGDLGAPFILEWEVPDVPKPTPKTLKSWVQELRAAGGIPRPTKTQFSVLEFRDRFTLNEQLEIRQAQLTDMEVGLVYDAFISAQYIDVTDPRVEQGIDLYIAKDLLDPSRKAELLAAEPIE